MGKKQQQNSGTTGGGFTLTGVTRKVPTTRREWTGPRQAPKGIKRPPK